MNHVQACLSATKDGESSFHCCGGLLKLMQAYFSCQERARKHFSSLWGC